MKDRLLFETIALLIGIIAMQWMMPSGHATVVTLPVGNVVAAAENSVLTTTGEIWFYHGTEGWLRYGIVPLPVGQIQFFTNVGLGLFRIVDKSGNSWEQLGPETWVNRGQPPVNPVGTSPATLGKMKAIYQPKDGKP